MGRRILTTSAAVAALLAPLVEISGQTAQDVTRDTILAAGREWQEKHDQYQPEADMVEALKARAGSDMRIDVYLGLWCKDSRNNVPLFIKILDRLGGSVPVRYISVTRKANKEIKYFVEDLKIDRVPTFVFYRGGKEIGRIIENPKAGMLEDLMEIVFKEN